MKTSLKVSLTLLALAVGASAPLVRAQESTTDKPKHERREDGPRGDRLKMMSEHLGLTQEQKGKIAPLLKSEAGELRALREDTATDRDAKRTKMMEIRKKYGAQIRALLTAEQQVKFDEMQKRMRERRPGGPHGEGTPPSEPPSGDTPPL